MLKIFIYKKYSAGGLFAGIDRTSCVIMSYWNYGYQRKNKRTYRRCMLKDFVFLRKMFIKL